MKFYFITILVLLLLVQDCSGYKRSQFDACIQNNCSVQKELCRLDYECSSNELDYLYCIGSNEICRGNFSDEVYSQKLVDCFKDCDVVSSNKIWNKLNDCFYSCNSFKMTFYFLGVLFLIFSLM